MVKWRNPGNFWVDSLHWKDCFYTTELQGHQRCVQSIQSISVGLFLILCSAGLHSCPLQQHQGNVSFTTHYCLEGQTHSFCCPMTILPLFCIFWNRLNQFHKNLGFWLQLHCMCSQLQVLWSPLIHTGISHIHRLFYCLSIIAFVNIRGLTLSLCDFS